MAADTGKPGNLIAFLKERIDEDEAAAKACADCDGYLDWFDSKVTASGDHTIRTRPGNRTVARIRRGDVEGDFGRLMDPDAAAVHLARHDPARVLREVAAKRAILAIHVPDEDGDCLVCITERVGYQEQWAWDAWPCLTLRHLAAVWSDHPDYRAEWALLPRC